MHLNSREFCQIKAYLTKTLKPNLLNSLLKTLNPSKALHLYNQILPISDHFTFTYSLKACSLLPAILTPKALEIHAHTIKSAHIADLFVQNSLINFYSSAADLTSARKVFAEMLDPDIVSWTSMVTALARHNCPAEAVAAFALMDSRPNALTLVSVLPACSELGAVKLGKSVHGYGLKSVGGHGNNIVLDNAILDMYFTCGDTGMARNVFQEMPERDVVSWTTVIAGYARNGRFMEAVDSFVLMLMDGDVMPNEATLVSVLGACASMGSLRVGKLVHSYLFTSCIGVDMIVGNALINMYSKCGDIRSAFVVFRELQCKDLVSWCTVIGAMAVSGHARVAFQLFAQMLCNGLRPDGVAFLALLSACCHAGLVEQSSLFLMAMREVYGVEPQKEHYACLIDTLGRTGRLEEAEELVCNMPVEVDSHIWGGLLSACQLHGGDRDMLERLEKRFLRGEVSAGGGTYALMSNMMAKDGRWDESISVRNQMKVRRLPKTTGCSWIEVCGLEQSG